MARILVVDDQQTVLTLIARLLEGKGHSVVTATEPHGALDKIAKFSFDLVITDVMMPGSSGLDLARTIRATEKFQTLPILFLTGKRERKDVERGISAGADDYAVKPVDPDILLTKVEALLKKRGVAAFADTSINESATWDSKIDVVAISEAGLMLMSRLKCDVGTKVKINSALFMKIGIAPPLLRVTEVTSVEADSGFYYIKTQFVGLTEKELQPIRVFVRNQSSRRAA